MQVSDMPMTRQVVSHDSPVQSGIESYRHYTVAENLCWARKEFRFQRDAKRLRMKYPVMQKGVVGFVRAEIVTILLAYDRYEDVFPNIL